MSVDVPTIDEPDRRRQNRAIAQLAQGRSNATGTVTLTTGQSTTTVDAPHCTEDSTVLLQAMHANAAAEIAAGTMYVSSVGNGRFVITHANSATANRTFRWFAVG